MTHPTYSSEPTRTRPPPAGPLRCRQRRQGKPGAGSAPHCAGAGEPTHPRCVGVSDRCQGTGGCRKRRPGPTAATCRARFVPHRWIGPVSRCSLRRPPSARRTVDQRAAPAPARPRRSGARLQALRDQERRTALLGHPHQQQLRRRDRRHRRSTTCRPGSGRGPACVQRGGRRAAPLRRIRVYPDLHRARGPVAGAALAQCPWTQRPKHSCRTGRRAVVDVGEGERPSHNRRERFGTSRRPDLEERRRCSQPVAGKSDTIDRSIGRPRSGPPRPPRVDTHARSRNCSTSSKSPTKKTKPYSIRIRPTWIAT